MAGESRFWGRLQPRLQSSFFIQRIENLVGEGVPDVFLVRRETGVMCWVELKSRPKFPVRATTKVFGDDGLRPSQIAWIHGRAVAGAAIFILAECDKVEFLIEGRWAREFNAWTKSELEAHAVAHGVRLPLAQLLP